VANVLLTDLKGFANPVIARRLQAGGATIIGCDPAILGDGVDEGVNVVGWGSPGEIVAKAASQFGGALDAS
jgi:hypothetical protein